MGGKTILEWVRFFGKLLVQVISNHISKLNTITISFSLSRAVIKLILRCVIAGQFTAWLLILASLAEIIDIFRADCIYLS